MELSRDQPVGDRPEETSEADFKLFEAKRRAERQQVDVDEGKLTRSEQTQFAADVLEQGKHKAVARG